MEYPSKLLKTYYNSIDSTEENVEKIAIKIAEEVKQKYITMYGKVIGRQISTINSFIEEAYITCIAEDIKETSKKIWGAAIESKQASEKNYHYYIHYDALVVENIESKDNFVDLSKALQCINCNRNYIKELQREPANLSKNIVNIASNDYPVDKNYWFSKRINDIVKKLNKNEFNIHEIIIYIISMAIADKVFYKGWLQSAIEIFRKHIPYCWNNCVYSLYLIDKYALLDRGIKKQDESTRTCVQCKKAYALIMHLSITDYISSFFIKSKDSSSYKIDDYNTFKSIDNYFGKGDNFKGVFKDFIYYTKDDKCKNRIPNSLFLKKIYYVGLVSLLSYLYTQYTNRVTNKKATKFITSIDPTIDSSKFRWSIAIDFLEEPSLEERLFLHSLEEALTVQNNNPQLLLFTETEIAIRSEPQSDKVINIISQVAKAKKQHLGKTLQKKINPLLTELVLECDGIVVDFSSLDFIRNFKHDLSKCEYVIRCLNAYEICYLDFLRKDVYYAHEVENKNYESIRNSLKYRARNLNASIFDVYKNIVTAIESYYFSAQCSDKNLYTERDFLYALNTYAWCKLKTNLNIYLDNNNPADNTYSCDLIKSSKLFVACNILDNNCDFISEEELLACAAMGFVEGYEHYNPEDVTNLLLMLLEKYCLQSDLSNSSHLELFSKPFVTFGAICILGLSHSYKKIVITRLCQEANKVVLAKNRKAQQTLIILLNTLIIQPKVRLDSETSEKLLNTIFNRVLYPHQMLSIGRIEQHPFLKSILHNHKAMLDSPKVVEDCFPSPFFMYLFANEYAANAKKETTSDKYCLIFKNEHIVWNKKFTLLSVADFYRSAILLEGVSWRITNTDVLGNKKIIFDKEVIIQMVNICYNHWAEIDTSVATDDLLMLTWGSHLLLTAFCNLSRENKFLSINDGWDHEKLLVIAINADMTQRIYNDGYQHFLKYPSDHSSETSPSVPEFWLISGGLRYSSLLQTAPKRPENIQFFKEKSRYVTQYCEILRTEKKSENNYRFFMLLSRLLSYTNFFEVIDEEYNDINPKSNDLPNNITDLFLAYDNIEPYLKSIKPPKKD